MKYGKYSLGNVEAIFNKLGGESVIDRLLSDEVVVKIEERVKPQKPALLIPLPKLVIAATDTFEVEKHIKVDTSRKATVKISYVSPDFQSDFYGFTEEAQPESDLYPHKTTRYARYSEMRTDLGGDAVIPTTLAKIYAMTKKQPNGEEGDLLNDGRANLFEVTLPNGERRLVDVYWRDDGWAWLSSPVDCSRGWIDDRQVFSGNSRPVGTEKSR